MIIFMSDILCVTNRNLCKKDFLLRVEEMAECEPAGMILREKDLTEEAYRSLAKQVMKICQKYQVPCILHKYVQVGMELKADAIHLPLPMLRSMSRSEKESFRIIGASCHSVEEALEAERLGSTYITAGHIFATDCKKGMEPRGIEFLKKVCTNISIPVYAIGGVNPVNIVAVRAAGAKGACIMSGWMTCETVEDYLKSFEKEREEHEVSS